MEEKIRCKGIEMSLTDFCKEAGVDYETVGKKIEDYMKQENVSLYEAIIRYMPTCYINILGELVIPENIKVVE